MKDCRIDTFRSGGPGGQNQNKRDTGVRIHHDPSGAVGESREMRTQELNKRKAFVKMAESEKFRTWHRIECARRLGQETIEDRVDKAMQPHNLLIEGRVANGWETIDV